MIESLGVDVQAVLIRQFNLGSEFRFFQGGKRCDDLIAHLKATVTLKELFDYPIRDVPDAYAQRQHYSWSTQGCLLEFPGKDSNCHDAEN